MRLFTPTDANSNLLDAKIHHLKRTLLNDSMNYFSSQHDPKKFVAVNRKMIENSIILLPNLVEMS